MGDRARGRRTDYEWVDIRGAITAMDNAEGTAALGDGSFTALKSLTVTRMRGLVGVQLDTTGVDERILLSMGIIVVSQDAGAVGITALPKPQSDGNAPWVWHGHAWCTSLSEAGVSTNGMYHRVEIDSKAMRKMKSSEQLVFVAEIADAVDQGGQTDLQYGFRLLTGV